MKERDNFLKLIVNRLQRHIKVPIIVQLIQINKELMKKMIHVIID
jgi:hypothetical protein